MAELPTSPDSSLSESVAGRGPLIAAITTFLGNQDAQTLNIIRHSLARELDAAGPDAVASLCEGLANTGADWQYYPRNPLARRIHEVLADKLLAEDATLVGAEHVPAVDDKPVVIVANHLSYSDANLLEVLLQRAGCHALSDRLTVMAGPKVYSSLKRRFSSLCFGTIKTPQASGRSSEDAVMNTREVARAARQVIETALERLRLGEALLVFPEGTRSRTACMQETLPGVTRYFECPGTWVLPVGITGTEALFPVGVDTLQPVPIVARVGRAFPASLLEERAGGNRRLMMDTVGLAIASVLPPEYQGAYAEDVAGLDEARALWRELSA